VKPVALDQKVEEVEIVEIVEQNVQDEDKQQHHHQVRSK
jgi:hypothetical protein